MAPRALPIGSQRPDSPGGGKGPKKFQVASRESNLRIRSLDEDTSLFTTRGRFEKGGDYVLSSSEGERSDVVFRRVDLKGTDITLGEGVNEVEVTRSRFTGVSYASSDLGENKPESIVFGAGVKANRLSVSLGGGGDSIEFRAGSKVERAFINLGEGLDSIVFGAGSKVAASTVDLGGDSNADVVRIDDGSKAKGLLISNFAKEDTLIVGGETLTYDQLKNDPNRVQGVNFRFDQA